MKYMLPRFFAPDLDPSSSFVTLRGDEARHATRVLRLSAGDAVSVFDGRGGECHGLIEVAVRDTVTVQLAGRVEPPAPPPVRVVVVQAVLKGSSMDDAVRDATMMGADAIQPILAAHGDVKPSFAKRPETVERWRRVALAAVKQSRRGVVPPVHDVQPLHEWRSGASMTPVLFFVEPSAPCRPRTIRDVMDELEPVEMTVVLGPEGGWAAEEVDAAVATGWVPVTLGPLTLRAESMPVAALAALYAVAR